MAIEENDNASPATTMERAETQASSNDVDVSTGNQDIDDEPKDRSKRGKKRKQHWKNESFRHGKKYKGSDMGGRRNADLGRNSGEGGEKGREMGRKEYFAQQLDKRDRNSKEQEKRRQRLEEGVDNGVLPKPFSKEEIEAEDRRPKRKVAVMIGYAGTGYKGMQINTSEKTIEGDLFTAFVAAGAISKANADDPKKSSLVRCARTDKGVHAAGNIISLKLITEDEDIVKKINSHLPDQIRVWGIQRTTGSFSCYQACDSRWYEYLIPTHCFLPPHPGSFLAKQLAELAVKYDDKEGYDQRQEEVAGFWGKVDEEQIKPILEEMDGPMRELVEKALFEAEDVHSTEKEKLGVPSKAATDIVTQPDTNKNGESNAAPPEQAGGDVTVVERGYEQRTGPTPENGEKPVNPALEEKKALDAATKRLRKAYISAKKAWRIPDARLERVQKAFELYCGTHNFHNFTIKKSFKDPSAKRLIKSWNVSKVELEERGTEWLSLKVHGQSFMMHQIRKMVGAVALLVRCGTPLGRLLELFGDLDASIPKAPSLGLWLERPVFDSYNERAAEKFGKEKIDFSNYEKEMLEFKQREIYDRIHREEEESNQFHVFFSHLDNYREPSFLYLTAGGFDAVNEARKTWYKKENGDAAKAIEVDSDDDAGQGDG